MDDIKVWVDELKAIEKQTEKMDFCPCCDTPLNPADSSQLCPACADLIYLGGQGDIKELKK